ncbi:YoaK family protein [Sphingomonas abietis]|uniref:YoaK family protein n=1 Tax=Sphingomonas abietis TaxID=3012344 RepID=A0ABY7NGJ3_9SPHN|nr:YoaK family protein [Sphingomonas abietis]WBO20681.1 YoaK family protein [Sphingomonas abietis]
MLIRQGDKRNERIDRWLASVLASVAGGLNAAVFHAVGFFSANMTGNVSALSSLLAYGRWLQGLGYLSIVMTFVGGAMASTLVIDAGLRRGMRPIYARVVIAEALLLALLWLTEVALPRLVSGVPLLILGLSFLMGLQNAVVTHISNARIRTTHVSGMATDVGIELAKLVHQRRQRDKAGENEELVTKLRLHLQTIGFFLAGGIVGVLLYRLIGIGTLLIASLPLLLISVPPVWGARKTSARAR